MSFRRRLLWLFALTVIASVGAVTAVVSVTARRAFDRANDERTASLLAQFRSEFARRGEELTRRTEAVAQTPEAQRMAVAAAQTVPNYNAFFEAAQTIAQTQGLDFLEFADDHGTIISSAEWPAKFGYQEALASPTAPGAPFLKQEETPAGPSLGLFAVHAIPAGERELYIIGGVRLDRTFLSSLELPAGMRVMLYVNLEHPEAFSADKLLVTGNAISDAQPLAALVKKVESTKRDASEVVHWGDGDDETVTASLLRGVDNQLLGILLVGSSHEIYNVLRGQIRSAALLGAAVGLLLAVLLSSWAAARVTKPVEDLARAAGEIANGNWNARVETKAKDEIGALADSFNRMTRDLLQQRERLLQAERVAAWRELARRLAHELKNPLFPLQLTVENLLRSREHSHQEFEETFRESAATLLAEIANLKNIVARFSEFSKMPQPQFQSISPDELITKVVKVYELQFRNPGIQCTMNLSAPGNIAADSDLLHRAFSNLILNAIEAMPRGGSLTVRTSGDESSCRVEISDSGPGLSAEESAHLFTPYYTSKPHGTGLGLAIVQSIVSDHGGRISVNSEPGRGTTFIIELPNNHEKLRAAQSVHV